MENNNIRVWNKMRERSVNNNSFSHAVELFQNCTGVSKTNKCSEKDSFEKAVGFSIFSIDSGFLYNC